MESAFLCFGLYFSIGLPWLFVYQKMVPMKSRWLPSTPNIIEPYFFSITCIQGSFKGSILDALVALYLIYF
ncbi:hypothetical protein, partial [Aerococcus mictus]|uniref:hypothetical protein n=1 Tax=Aerococcus mictus TaxID=2976810 RepID=UPI001CD35516